jgi:response regulator of citrate/malate metabolism
MYEWYKRFKVGRTPAADDQRSGITSISCEEIKEIVDGDPRMSVPEIAEKCDNSKTTIHKITENMSMTKECFSVVGDASSRIYCSIRTII